MLCPRCGYRLTDAGETTPSGGGPVAPGMHVLSSGEPVTNPPGVNFGPAAGRKLRRLAPTPRGELSAPSEHGRYKPDRLWGRPRKGSLDPALSESFRFSAINATLLKTEFEDVARTLGFVPAEVERPGGDHDSLTVTSKSVGHGGSAVSGWFYAERDLKADTVVTHRKDRIRWLGIFGCGIPAAILFYIAGVGGRALFLLSVPIGILFGLALVSAITFANTSYWSDVIAMRILADVPRSGEGLNPIDVPAIYVAQFWVVRALSQDWQAKGRSGRSLLAGIDSPGLDAVRAALRTSFSSTGPL